MKTLHEEKSDYKSDYCGKSCTQAGHLKNHMKTLHEGQRNYKCNSCGKSFKESGHLKMHINTIHEEQKNDLNCDLCENSFSQLFNLKSHIMVHIDKKNHKCDICGKLFHYYIFFQCTFKFLIE